MIPHDCGDAEALLGAYRDALTSVKLLRSKLVAGSSERDRETAERAARALLIARQEYWRHVQTHRCAEIHADSHSAALPDPPYQGVE